MAVDRPLTGRQMRELRACSTRATITPARFVNTYEWSDLKAAPAEWMAKYFDAFLHDTNWGSRSLMFRLPRRLLDLRAARRYCRGGSATARAAGESVILELRCDEDAGWEEIDSEGWLPALLPLRAQIAQGDHRALYLAWLRGVQAGELDGKEVEPPCPPGLGTLNASLRALAEFLCIDAGLLAVDSEGSRAAPQAIPRDRLRRWIAGLPEGVKTDALADLLREDAPEARARLLRLFRETAGEPDRPRGVKPRRAGALQAAARRLVSSKGGRRRPRG